MKSGGLQMSSEDNFTNEEFERFTNRMRAFKEIPKSLSPEIYEKCKALNEEIRKDSMEIEKLISQGHDVKTIPEVNTTRSELVDWLSKTP